MPHKYDLAGTVGVVALDVVLGGIIGGFALIRKRVKWNYIFVSHRYGIINYRKAGIRYGSRQISG